MKSYNCCFRRHTSGGGIYNVNLADTQSRDSPIGGGTYCIVNENDDNSTAHADGSTSATKHTHRKSVFKKRGTSSPSMVSRNTNHTDANQYWQFFSIR